MKTSQSTRLALVLGGVVVLAYLISSYSSNKAVVGEGLETAAQQLGVMGPLSDGGPMASAPQALEEMNSPPSLSRVATLLPPERILTAL